MTVIAQLSDIHVRPHGVLYQDAVDSNVMFSAAVDSLNRIRPEPDLIVISGDLTDEGTEDEYQKLRELLVELRRPFVVLPGNHDDRGNLRAAFSDHAWLPNEGALSFALDVGELRLVALDTSVPGLHHGELDAETLAWLDSELTEHRSRTVVIVMHHPPFMTGIPYLDVYGLRNADAFARVLARHSNVDRILAGHVHRSMQTRLGSVPVLTCPSTTTQIALRVEADAQPASFLEPPAYMLHRWTGRGQSAVSHLCYVGHFEGPFPFA
ncbi:phosphodiesterase [Burkholderia cepacia]|uniref:phosphodiesterase n=1 Tax=Burkholderia cepacia TaxID=292 RepID=UPI00157A9B91|nr:phosphodiesterase [Burkholderia cepacia]NTX49637.1 phosphodiesterase [Burkholderia cepacia]